MLTVKAMRSLPLPTDAQLQRFIQHLQGAHSWYKHLPLLTGGTFVVFLAPDAGRDYPTEHPSLPFGNTVEGYRRAFGYLDYLWRIDGEPFSRDSGKRLTTFPRALTYAPVELPDDFLQHFSFVLYPYIAHEFYWSVHQEAVQQLCDGEAEHPQRALILELVALEEAREEAEAKMTEEEEEELFVYDADEKMYVYNVAKSINQLSPRQAAVLKLQRQVEARYALLRNQEMGKLEQQLHRLCEWYLSGKE